MVASKNWRDFSLRVPDFSLRVPDSWTYVEYSNTGMDTFFGRGPVNVLVVIARDFAKILLANEDDDRPVYEKLLDGGAYSAFRQDVDYSK